MKLFVTVVFLLLHLFKPVQSEVKEQYFGKSEGYPIARGFPFSYEPKYRVGAYSGRAIDEFFKDRDIYLSPTALERKTKSIKGNFPFNNNPEYLLDKHPLMALMLVKEGVIVYEGYRYGTNEKSRFNSESMAKSFTALAVGKALQDGYIKNLDEKIGDIVVEIKDSAVGNATIRQALNMVCGNKFKFGGPTAYEYLKTKFGGSGYSEYDNIFAYFKQLPQEVPGKNFSYDPHCSDALSMVVTKKTGKRLSKYFEEAIWKNLTTTDRGSWMNMNINRGIDSGANLFNASLHDFSQIALLMQNDGRVDDKQILEKKWIEQMIGDSVSVGAYPSRFKRYGYQTWIRNEDASSWYAFLGWNGQRIYIDKVSKSILIAIALEEDHVGDTDKFWDWFRGQSLKNIR
jgi:CubicO group peptidase (beta-lactamase class C family)